MFRKGFCFGLGLLTSKFVFEVMCSAALSLMKMAEEKEKSESDVESNDAEEIAK